MKARVVPCVVALVAACDAPSPTYRALTDGSVRVDAAPPRRALPQVPVGLDGYRLWTGLPYVRIGVRATMQGTHDRAGGDDDGGNFLRAERDNFYVPLDVEGSGVMYTAVTHAWHGSPWHYVVDGFDRVVTESSTVTPDRPVSPSAFAPAQALPPPLALTSTRTSGADVMQVPVAFREGLTVGFARTHRATADFVVHRFAVGADHLSQPLRPWDGVTPPDPDVVELLARAGTDIAPRGGELQTTLGTVDVPAEGAVALPIGRIGPTMLRAFQLRVARERAVAFGDVRLRVTWDDRATPSVDAPVALFFGAGTLYNRDVREQLVQSLLTEVRYAGADIVLTAYFPMPYFRGARFQLVGAGTAIPSVSWQARAEALDAPQPWIAYFHATARDHATPSPGVDLAFLDTRDVEGGGDWCGHLVGTAFTFSDRGRFDGLAGDPRFYFDDARAPQVQGTSTEAWAGGADHWGGRTVSLPLYGHPAGAPSPGDARAPEDLTESAYRLLVADAMPFGRNARVGFEHGGDNASTEHYRSVTWWYGRPGACLVPTDSVDVGDEADERAHAYSSPEATAPEMLTSRYDVGVDTVDGRVVVPEASDRGRRTTGTTEFTVQVDAANVGVMLRRTYDRALPDQRAEVWVAEAGEGHGFAPAGVWYAAGGAETVYSNPPTEQGLPTRTLRTSPRRWAEDEFLLPRALTEGRRALRIRLRYAPMPRPVVPGAMPRASAWSEFAYRAWAYVLPER